MTTLKAKTFFVILFLFLANVTTAGAGQCSDIERIVAAFDTNPASLRGQQNDAIDGTRWFTPTIQLSGLGACNVAVDSDSPEGRYTCSDRRRSTDGSAFASIIHDLESCSLHFRGSPHTLTFGNSTNIIYEVVAGKSLVVITVSTHQSKSGNESHSFTIEKK